ncbi:MAG: DEAD/DEAH box helicase [Myxococcota bacterium]
MTVQTSAESEAPTFDQLPLTDEVRQALRDMDYERPTPVQTAVWESVAAGRDVVVQARTGTGKTTAFGLPLVDRIVRVQQAEPQALVLCPTRELALQVTRELDALGQHKGVTTTAIYGGAPMGKQIQAIADGAQIISGTPGRVLDHLRRRTLDPKTIRALVLDESDEMLSMGFEKELNAIIERLPETHQTLLFSATVPPDIERMAKTRLTEPEFIILSSDQVGALTIQHFVYWVSQNKVGALSQILETENPESAIVFCNTREATQRVAQALQREGFEADWLNGDLAQSDRERVMKATREGRLRFLVATDVAARGIDISHLTHVINYDFPQDAETYVHRTGRTGRAGKTGTAISLVTPREVGALYMVRLVYKIRPVERQLPTAHDVQTRHETDIVSGLVDVFSQQARSEEYHSLAQRLLTHDDAVALVAGMLEAHLKSDPEFPELAQSRRRSKTVVTPEEAEPLPPEVVPTTQRTAAEPSKAKKAAKPRVARRRREAEPDTSVEDLETASTLREPDGEQTDDSTQTVERAGDDAPTSEQAHDDAQTVELHVDAGRRDGARVKGLKSILLEAGLASTAVHRIRIRERYSFVEVSTEVMDAALEAFQGAEVGERTVKAQLSKRSREAAADAPTG